MAERGKAPIVAQKHMELVQKKKEINIRKGTKQKQEYFFKIYLFSNVLQNNFIPFNIISTAPNTFVLQMLPVFEKFLHGHIEIADSSSLVCFEPLLCYQLGVLSYPFS